MSVRERGSPRFVRRPDRSQQPTRAGPLELVGHVVRRTASGFAIEYEKPFDPRLLVKDAAAIIAAFQDS